MMIHSTTLEAGKHVYDADCAARLNADADSFGTEVLPTGLLAGCPRNDLRALWSLSRINPDSPEEGRSYLTGDDVAAVLALKTREFPPCACLEPCRSAGNLACVVVARSTARTSSSQHLVALERGALALTTAQGLLLLPFCRGNPELVHVLRWQCVNEDGLDMNWRPLRAIAIVKRIAKKSRGFASITPQSLAPGTKLAAFRRILLDS